MMDTWLDQINESKKTLFVFGLVELPISLCIIICGYTTFMDGVKYFTFFHYNTFVGNIFCRSNELELLEICMGSTLLLIGIITLIGSIYWIINGVISFITTPSGKHNGCSRYTECGEMLPEEHVEFQR